MTTIPELLARAAALREETALNSISPERAGGIMYDTIMAINELWLQQGSALVISKIYSSVSAMEADDEPVSDISGQPLRAGQIVVIASSDSDNGSVYRFGGISEGASVWSIVGLIGNITPVDALDSDSTQLPLAAHQGKVLDGKISQLGQKKLDKNIASDALYITDLNGYIIFKIDKDGIHAPNLSENGEVNSDNITIQDKNGYIVVRIDKDGIHSAKDKHAVACMVLSESYYPIAAPTRDSDGNITYVEVMFETGIEGSLSITYIDGNSSSVAVVYGNYNYTITINRDGDGNVETVNVQ